MSTLVYRSADVQFESDQSEKNLMRQVEVHSTAVALTGHLIGSADDAHSQASTRYPVGVYIDGEKHDFAVRGVVSVFENRLLCLINDMSDERYWILLGVRFEWVGDHTSGRWQPQLLPEVIMPVEESGDITDAIFGDAVAHFLKLP